ncbi:hypothetical protein MMC16_002173 [Acarospora aff. strigata]|nr:hypothetical protein [Acarospora aff. strigata]
MHAISTLLPLLLLTLTALTSTFPIALPTSLTHLLHPRTVASETDDLLFRTALSTFLARKAALQPPYLDWSDDGCSASPDRPSGYNFLDSCKRHDFGYRNYKKQARFTETARKAIDGNFKTDLYNECNKYSGWQSYKGVECRRIADVYYNAVRAFGGSGAHVPAIEGV